MNVEYAAPSICMLETGGGEKHYPHRLTHRQTGCGHRKEGWHYMNEHFLALDSFSFSTDFSYKLLANEISRGL
jgi:hypothetical protein